MGEARVRVSLSDGVLEFEGSESFVTGQVEKFTKIIQAALAGERRIADDAAAGGGGGTTDAGGNGASRDMPRARPVLQTSSSETSFRRPTPASRF